MSRRKEAYVISYHGTLCHDMSYVTTIVASLLYVGSAIFLICSNFSYALLSFGTLPAPSHT